MDALSLILILGGVVIVALLIVGVVVSSSSERRLVEDRLGRFLEEEKPASGEKQQSSFLTEWVNRRVERSSLGDRIQRDLARADLKYKVAEWVSLVIITTIGGALLGGMLGGWEIFSFVIGGAVGAILPRFYMRRQQRQRLVRFDGQLPDMLNLMVNGLRAGFSTMQAMEAVAKELPAPICDEFRRVVQEMQLGIPMEKALENLLRRIPSADLDFVVTAINVQREVGGNLSEILDTISFTIRERVRIKGEISVLTAQVRSSGQALAFMPIGLVVLLWFINREYMMGFFLRGPVCGYAAFGLAGTLIAVGYFIMSKIAAIEV